MATYFPAWFDAFDKYTVFGDSFVLWVEDLPLAPEAVPDVGELAFDGMPAADDEPVNIVSVIDIVLPVEAVDPVSVPLPDDGDLLIEEVGISRG